MPYFTIKYKSVAFHYHAQICQAHFFKIPHLFLILWRIPNDYHKLNFLQKGCVYIEGFHFYKVKTHFYKVKNHFFAYS